MTQIAATIGIPFFNVEKYLGEAVRSVLAQSFQDWELILYDDGSTDGSLEVARRYEGARVRVISDGQQRGLARRLNELSRLSSGRLVFRMDADDLMHPERVRLTWEWFAEHGFPDDVVVGTGAFAINESGRPLGIKKHGANPIGDIQRPFIHPTVAATRTWFLSHPYSENLAYHRAEDVELWTRAANDTRFVVIDRPLLFYREGGVFSLRNYVATAAGLIAIVDAQEGRGLNRSRRVLRELLKAGIAGCADAVGLADVLVSRRFREMTPAESEEAQRALESILGVTGVA